MNIFIDAGAYAGMALKKYVDEGIVDEDWIIYSFEPNPMVPVPPSVTRAAVWTEDGEMPLKIQGRHDAARLDPQGDCVVDTFDFSKFVSDLPKDAYIICSMDIEGAEYPVLEKMLKEKTIDRINVLDIEFHHRLLSEKTPEDSQKLIDKIEKRGTEVKLKVSLE